MGRKDLVSAIPAGLWASAEIAADALKSAASAVVATHIDADGISAAAIATSALGCADVKVKTRFFKKLDEAALKILVDENADIVWFTDLGSGSVTKLEGMRAVVTDHHMPETGYASGSRKGQALLTDFSTVMHVNPQLHGISGASDLSGAGSTFLVALAMN